jgi:crossover junction endodeoxyribonuclease RuvC
MSEKIIVGIDPGTVVTGFAFIACRNNQIDVLDFGCIRPPSQKLLSDRYLIIFEDLDKLFSKYGPNEMAIETQFVHKNVQSALKLGSAQGAAIIQAKKHQLKIYGYSPTEVKRAITGTGKAHKTQLQGAVTKLCGLKEYPKPQDAADALGIAICHAHRMNNVLWQQNQNNEL